MRVRVLVVAVIVLLCLVPVFLRVRAASGPTVQVSVQATDPNGLALHYQWKSTDGVIGNVNATTTTWTLPNGPGIHFAYVLVSNGHGGYTERRIAVNTDVIGTGPVIPPPVTLAAPASAAQVGDFYRATVERGTNGQQFVNVAHTPDAKVFVKNNSTGKRYPATTTVSTDLKGAFTVPGVPAGSSYTSNCSYDGGVTFSNCTALNLPTFSMPAAAKTDYSQFLDQATPQPVNGLVSFQDGTLCGTVNEFFNVHSTGTATLLNSSGTALAGPVRINEKGGFVLPYNASAASVKVVCESAPAVTTSFTPSTSGELVGVTIPNVAAPNVSNMTATFNGSSVGTFLPPPSGLPSDYVSPSDVFLADKGLDSQVSACQYYKAIGAVQTCDASGNFSGAISFEDWKRTVKIDKYATTTEYAATYVNRADLNLTRNHHSVTYGANQTAGYVCNYAGPPFALVNQQSDVDTAVGNAAAGKDLVACVAMDWTITTGVNGGKAFTRFLIFGPSGQLLPSVNLDGRREKYVPGTCIVCHGGDHYAGPFPSDGTGKPNVGAHFLPYDVGNFLFSSQAGLRQSDQETSIYHLNQNVLNTGPTTQEKELINGWYASGQVQNLNFLPASWQGQSSAATNFYLNVQARSCRGCHIAMAETYDWEHFANMSNLEVGTVCFGQNSWGWRGHSMPNSLVTMNRFWLSQGNAVGLPDQVAIFNVYPGVPGPPGSSCTLTF